MELGIYILGLHALDSTRIHMYTIYIYIERGRDLSIYIDVYTYLYIYIYIQNPFVRVHI